MLFRMRIEPLRNLIFFQCDIRHVYNCLALCLELRFARTCAPKLTPRGRKNIFAMEFSCKKIQCTQLLSGLVAINAVTRALPLALASSYWKEDFNDDQR